MGAYEFRVRGEWIMRTATTVAPVLPQRWQLPFLKKALWFVQQQWRSDLEPRWQPMGRMRVQTWDANTGELEVWVDRPERNSAYPYWRRDLLMALLGVLIGTVIVQMGWLQ